MFKISIIIPMYNSEKYIGKLIDSILNQNYKNYEIIIVDDESKDNSIPIVRNYQVKYDKIKLISIKNSGPGVARKIGFQNATGDLLFFIDSDDYLPTNDVLSKINKNYENTKFDILFYNYIQLTNGKEEVLSVFGNLKLKDGEIDKSFLKNHAIGGALWKKIFVKEKMQDDFFIDARNLEDFYTTYRYLDVCKKINITNDILYYGNRDNSNSLSKKNNINKIEQSVMVLEKMLKDCELKECISIVCLNYYYSLLKSYRKDNYVENNKKALLISINKLEKLINKKDILLKRKLKYKIKLLLCYLKK